MYLLISEGGNNLHDMKGGGRDNLKDMDLRSYRLCCLVAISAV